MCNLYHTSNAHMKSPVSILYKSTDGRYRPVSYPVEPITARCRFIKNASWIHGYYESKTRTICLQCLANLFDFDRQIGKYLFCIWVVSWKHIPEGNCPCKSYQHVYNVLTLHDSQYDVVSKLCACWDVYIQIFCYYITILFILFIYLLAHLGQRPQESLWDDRPSVVGGPSSVSTFDMLYLHSQQAALNHLLYIACPVFENVVRRHIHGHDSVQSQQSAKRWTNPRYFYDKKLHSTCNWINKHGSADQGGRRLQNLLFLHMYIQGLQLSFRCCFFTS